MLQRNPELPPVTVDAPEIVPEDSEPTEYQLQYLRRRERTRRRMGRVGFVATSIGVLVGTAYWADVAHNIQEEKEAEPGIYILADPLDEENNHKATIILDGFNTMNANSYTREIGESIQQYADGELWSVDYNNAPLNGKTIFESAFELAEKRGITSISVATYSMGDIPGVEVATDFYVSSPLPVEKISITAGPSDVEGLQPYRQWELDFAKNVAEKIPGATHSTFWRYVAELYFYKDYYIKDDGFNIGTFMKVGGSILKHFWEGDYTSNSFLLSQIDAMNSSDIKQNLEEIGEASDPESEDYNGKLPPIVMYFGTGKGGYDAMVNNKYSSEKICEYAETSGMPCFQYYVPGAVHSEYYRSVKEYLSTSQAAADKINPFSEARTEAYQDEQLQKELLANSDSDVDESELAVAQDKQQ